jgi:hypothetical protein
VKLRAAALPSPLVIRPPRLPVMALRPPVARPRAAKVPAARIRAAEHDADRMIGVTICVSYGQRGASNTTPRWPFFWGSLV